MQPYDSIPPYCKGSISHFPTPESFSAMALRRTDCVFRVWMLESGLFCREDAEAMPGI
jgi:hypothetical protein